MKYGNEILGGLLIGVASALPLLKEGRIAGVSGYASSALEDRGSLLFVAGLVLGGLAWRLTGGALPTSPDFPLWLWAVAGLLVGFGSRLGGGCTSGHGVCGLGRLSVRSLASVAIFMTVAIAVVVARRLAS